LPQRGQEVLGLLAMLEPRDEVINEPDEAHVASTVLLTPPMSPQIKPIVQVDVRR
jgi:hypothetical protein